jgi:hypothetical protein
MSIHRRLYRSTLLGILPLAMAVAACERGAEPLPVDTVAVPLPAEEDTIVEVPPVVTTWPGAAAGTALFIAGQTPSRAIVVLPEVTDLRGDARPDAGRVRSLTLDLFDRTGRVGQARLETVSDEPALLDCPGWPQGLLTPIGQSTALPSWSVAFSEGRVQPLTLRPLDNMSRADSARLAADATRLAAALPTDTVSSFHGIPFYVRMAYRFSPVPGTEALVAEVVRRVPLEAAPLEEHTIIVGERPSGDRDARWRTVFHERVSGVETAVSTWEVLAAVTLDESGTPALVLDSVLFEGDVYMLLERGADGRWRIRWSSAYAGC